LHERRVTDDRYDGEQIAALSSGDLVKVVEGQTSDYYPPKREIERLEPISRFLPLHIS